MHVSLAYSIIKVIMLSSLSLIKIESLYLIKTFILLYV